MAIADVKFMIVFVLLIGIKVLCAKKDFIRDSTVPCKDTLNDTTKESDRFNVTKSENDKRDYKYMILKNKLRILLVSDPGVEKSAAAVSINAGSSSDPPAVPGLAHFCEHMLFMGTSKYPDEAEFSNFINDHGGNTNAYTSDESTTYYMNVKSDALEPALDRFAQFFLSPLFNPNSTDRELHAVDQEFQGTYLNDWRRLDYIERSNSKPGHRYGIFGTGNLETLKTIPQKKKIDIRKMLLDFYEMYYSANIMTVAVVGKESLKDLEEMAVPLFEKVKNRKTMLPRNVFPYGKNEIGMMLKIPTVQEMNVLVVTFQYPDFRCLYKSKPSRYILQLVNHQGKGSLLFLLKQKGWANFLQAGDNRGLRGFEIFYIVFHLTQDGLHHIDDIITLMFQYVNMLKHECETPKRWFYDEMKALDANRFRFQDKQDPLTYAETLVENMHAYPPQDVLNGAYVSGEFMPERIAEILGYFSPEKLRYLVASKTFDGPFNKQAKYYNANYTSEKIPAEKIRKWMNVNRNKELHLPNKNPFIIDPDELNIDVPIKNNPVKGVPVIIKDNEISRVWYKADDTFYLPKSAIKITIYSPQADVTPSHTNHMVLFIKLIQDAVSEIGNDAHLANIGYGISSIYSGFSISINGFSSKQDVLLRKILHHVTSIKKHIKKDKFRVAKQELLESLKNQNVEAPVSQVDSLLRYAISEKFWNAQEMLQYVEELSVESLSRYIHSLLQNIYIEGMFFGNMLRSHALTMFSSVEQILIRDNHSKAMLPMQHLRPKEYDITQGSNYLYEKRSKIHSLSAVKIYLQVGLHSEHNNVLCELFESMIRSHVFDTLRTKEQLGYVVHSDVKRSQSVQGISITVQSEKEPSHVEVRIDRFFEMYKTMLLEMSEKKFDDYVKATVVSKLEKPKQLAEEAGIFGSEIHRRQYHFRRAEKEVEILRKLKKDDVVKFFRKYIDPESKHRKKLAAIVLGVNATTLSDSKMKNWTTIKDVLTFKTRLPLYPHIMPYNNFTLLSSKKVKFEDEL